jgi:adenosylmethionine-8-amino-7-oxononanoate aminotransferase
MSAPHDLSPEWLQRGWPHIWLPYTQMHTASPPLPVVAAEGSLLTLTDGTQLVDGISAWWSVCHGYNHPHIREVVESQLARFPHIMFGGLAHEPAYTLASRLCTVAPKGLDRVFFADSGSIAVEVALKMALQYWRNKGETKRTKFICFRGGYHGDTFGAMSVSDRSNFTAGFDSALTRNYLLDIPRDEYAFSEFADTVAAIRGTVAAIIIEPLVQCAGGFHFHSADILSEIRRVAREQDILFIADEIATGFGRTGTMFACEEAAITPDILCLGKALTGGTMSLAATLASARVFDAFLGDSPEKALMHGPTFMANPLACSAALASLDLFEREPRLVQVEQIEQQLWQELKPLLNNTKIRDVRVKGAIGVVEFIEEQFDTKTLRSECVARGAWLRPFGNCLYIMPPFTTSVDELSLLTRVAREVLI